MHKPPDDDDSPTNYEFSADQETLLRSLTRYLFAFGALLGLGGGVALLMGFEGPWYFFVQGILMLLIGAMTAQAGLAFRGITTTRGNDIPLLMDALKNLRSIYAAQVWMIGFVLAILAIIAALIVINPD